VRVRVQHRSVLAVGSIGVAVKHCAAHWTEKKRHATLQRTTAQPAQSMAVLIRITSRREHESSRARHDSPATPLARTPRCGSHLFQNCGESRTQSHRLAWQEKIPPQYRTCPMATQLPTATSLIVIPSFGRTYISPDAAEFANSRRRPAGGWYFGTLRLRSPTPAAPPACCTGVVRSAAATACRGPAGGDFDLLDSSPLERRLQEKYSTSHCASTSFSLAVQI
jgi:hypothetical protein